MSQKKSQLSKIWKNSHKSYKIYQNFSAILEDGDFKTTADKKNVKKIMECILYIEMNKKVFHKIVRKTDIKNITSVF